MLKPEAATIGLFVVLVIVLLQRNFLLAPTTGPGLTFDNDLYKFLRDFFKHEYLQGTSQGALSDSFINQRNGRSFEQLRTFSC